MLSRSNMPLHLCLILENEAHMSHSKTDLAVFKFDQGFNKSLKTEFN